LAKALKPTKIVEEKVVLKRLYISSVWREYSINPIKACVRR